MIKTILAEFQKKESIKQSASTKNKIISENKISDYLFSFYFIEETFSKPLIAQIKQSKTPITLFTIFFNPKAAEKLLHINPEVKIYSAFLFPEDETVERLNSLLGFTSADFVNFEETLHKKFNRRILKICRNEKADSN